MSDSYKGPVRILGQDGILLTAGVASLEADPEMRSWRGILETLQGTGVAGKALIVELVLPEGGRGRAQLTPNQTNGEIAFSTVTGLGEPPF